MNSVGATHRPPARPAVTARLPVVARTAAAVERSETASNAGTLSFWIFCTYTFILIGRPQDYIPALLPLRLGILFTGLSVLTTVFRTASAESPFRQIETKLYFAFFAIMCLGIPLAIHRRDSFDFVFQQYSVNMVFYLLFIVHVNSISRFRRIGVILMFSSLILTQFALRFGEFQDGRITLGNQMYDPNDVAFVQIALLAFSVWTVLGSSGRLMKLVALVTSLLGVLLTLYTGSRGGLIGVGIFFLLFMVLRAPHLKRSFKVLLILGIAVVGVLNVDKINVDRVQDDRVARGRFEFRRIRPYGHLAAWRAAGPRTSPDRRRSQQLRHGDRHDAKRRVEGPVLAGSS